MLSVGEIFFEWYWIYITQTFELWSVSESTLPALHSRIMILAAESTTAAVLKTPRTGVLLYASFKGFSPIDLSWLLNYPQGGEETSGVGGVPY
jgi:hypothetical protein